jgi:LysM repeat protein
MTSQPGPFRGLLLLLLLLCLSGCGPSGSGRLDEEKEPHYLAGKSRISMLDYPGAIDCFEKALQVNPKSASAHFELAWVYDQKEVDPAAAIYHYNRYLTLRSKPPENAEVVRQRISACKQALADTVYVGPLTGKIQKQLEQVGEENKRLTEQNKWLQQELAKWTNYAGQLQGLTNRFPVQALESPRVTQPARSPQTSPATLVSATSATAVVPLQASVTTRTHTVKPGDTPSLIARKYGVKLESLMSANPSLDARRLKVGQVLRVPGS